MDNGADLNVDGKDYRTPLHIAASNGHLNIVEYLVKKIDPVRLDEFINAKDKYGYTPLHYAIQIPREE
ncbi:ankyrin repeat domain-containing protein [Wolbachia endosymbiont (group E) of Neria commutata]|uniref:ankyrin repeat domain-containing protein n=1 Tax=Wolbachia endosymbiont (group E) of Neria commutata TaxID=3066149 RepID=UPI003978EA7B